MSWRKILADMEPISNPTFEEHSEGIWYALVNNFESYRNGAVRIVFSHRDESLVDGRIIRLRDKAERVLKRTNFDKEFTKVRLTVEKI